MYLVTASQLTKDASILNLLSKLNEEFGESFYDIVEHWEASLDSIGIASPKDNGVLVYITTNEPSECTYQAHLELPSSDEEKLYVGAGIKKNLDFASLKKVIENHFEENT